MEDTVRRAITLIRSGNKDLGQRLLAGVLLKEPNNINAWIWLSSCLDDKDQIIYCLKKVLTIDPGNITALSALRSIEEQDLPTEGEIVGRLSQTPPVSKIKPEVAQQMDSNNQKSVFQPKYLTALAGLMVLMGAFLPWARSMYYEKDVLEVFTGLSFPIGVLTAVVGILVIFLSIFIPGKTEHANSLPSSLIGLAFLFALPIWATMSYESCFEHIFGDACEYTTIYGTGTGYALSLLSLLFVFIFGLIRNPKKAGKISSD